MITLKIGDPVWIFNENNRVYPPGPSISHAPIYREHWMKFSVIGETSRCYIVGVCTFESMKLHKKGPVPPGVALSLNEVEADCWVHDNSHRISDAVGRLRDYSALKRIDEILEESKQ